MEFDKYKHMGDYHWREYENRTAYGKHADKVKDWVRAGKTLDIGAGDGLITSLIPDCIGVDDNKIAVDLAKEKGVKVFEQSAYELAFPKHTFDNALMLDVIEHLLHPADAIEQVKKVLKPDGYFYVVTPPAFKGGLHDPYHYREYSPETLTEFMEQVGFELVNEIEVVPEYHRMYALFKRKR